MSPAARATAARCSPRAPRAVTGADIAQSAVDHARARYAAVTNLDFRQADCAALPFADASFDAVVSFETIEHIVAQEPFLDEIRRVLRPDGLLILSCPNKAEYSDRLGVTNEFHVRELYRDELAALIAPRFAHALWYGQRPSFYSVVWPEAGHRRAARSSKSRRPPPTPPRRVTRRPLYFIVVASASAARLAGVAPRLSVLADRDEWVHRDYEKVMRDLEATHRRSNDLDAKLSLRAARSGRPGPGARCAAGAPRRPSARASPRGSSPAARDRAPREPALVAGAAAAPGLAGIDRPAAVGRSGLVTLSRVRGTPGSIERQDDRLVVGRLRLAIDAHVRDARTSGRRSRR